MNIASPLPLPVLRFADPEAPPAFTGERYVSDINGPIRHEHYHRYLFAAQFCAERDVLDIACGEGYGSALLGQVARGVVGVDIDVPTVEFAGRTYGSARVRFCAGGATRIPLADASIDVVVSFETLEHFAEQESFLAEVARVLRPDGLMVISSPNRTVYSEQSGFTNHFHVRELDEDGFRDLLASHFAHIRLLAQRAVCGSVLVSGEPGAARHLGFETTDGRSYDCMDGVPSPHYFVALASTAPLPPVPDSVLQDAAYLPHLDARLAAAELHAVKLARETTLRDAEIARLNGVAASRNAEITRLGDDAASQAAKVARLASEAASRNAELAQLATEAASRNAEITRLGGEMGRLKADPFFRLGIRLRQSWLNGPHARRLSRLAWWTLSGQLLPRLRERRAVRRIRASHAFADDWYLRANPDVAASGMDPLLHYVAFGAAQNLDPSPEFSTAWYCASHPGLRPGCNPLLDAVRHGRVADGRRRPARQRTPRLSDAAQIAFLVPDAPNLAIVLDGRAGLEPLLPTLSVLVDEAGATGLEVLLLVVPGSDLALTGARRVVAAIGDTAATTRAVDACRAPYVVILEPGVVPVPNAITALTEAFAAAPAAGLVCGKVLDAQDMVIHAGGCFMPDGQVRRRGAGLPAGHYEVASITAVDVAPPGLLAVATGYLKACGGLGTEDGASWFAAADLAERMRAAGATVLCQPFAEAVATTTPDPMTASQAAALLVRHGSAIASRRTPNQPRALFVDYQTPKPDRDSGSGDIYWLMRIMLDFGYDVTFLPAFSLMPAEGYTDALRKLGIVCVASPDVTSPEAFLRQHAASFDVALLHRVPVAARLVDLLRQVAPDLRIVFNTVDLHFLREQREAELSGVAEQKATAEATRKREMAVIRRADMTILLSPAEQAIVAAEVPEAITRVIPVVREIPGLEAPLDHRRDVVFVGGFAHLPNVDAITHFVAACWPLVHARLPDARLLVVGSDPPPAVLALAGTAAGIDILGYVEDLGALLRRCRLTVAPLRYGAGIKGKVVSSMAHGVPCVATPVAVEGMGIIAGQQAMIAEDPTAFAAAVVRVYEDDALWQALSHAGVILAEANFSVARVRALMRDLLADLFLPPGKDAGT